MAGTGKTAARGYGGAHQRLRRRLVAELAANPGQPCGRCGHAMYVEQELDLDHDDDRTGYRGLAHSSCNRRSGAQKGARVRNGQRAPMPTSRKW